MGKHDYTWLQLRWWTRAPKFRVSVTGWEQDHSDRCQHRSTWTSRECFFLSRSPPSFRLSPSRWLRGEKEEAMQCGYLIVGVQVFVELNGQSSDCLASQGARQPASQHVQNLRIILDSWIYLTSVKALWQEHRTRRHDGGAKMAQVEHRQYIDHMDGMQLCDLCAKNTNKSNQTNSSVTPLNVCAAVPCLLGDFLFDTTLAVGLSHWFVQLQHLKSGH